MQIFPILLTSNYFFPILHDFLFFHISFYYIFIFLFLILHFLFTIYYSLFLLFLQIVKKLPESLQASLYGLHAFQSYKSAVIANAMTNGDKACRSWLLGMYLYFAFDYLILFQFHKLKKFLSIWIISWRIIFSIKLFRSNHLLKRIFINYRLFTEI